MSTPFYTVRTTLPDASVRGITLRVLGFSSGIKHVNYQFKCLQFKMKAHLSRQTAEKKVPAAVEI